jgi:AcrR family transcriptional regulator
MKRPRRRYHHGDLRNALIEQAVKLVEEGGAEGFSLREAARLVGVTANAAYRHFADRSDLLAAVAEVGYRRQEQCMLKALSAVSDRSTAAAAAVERLKAAGRGYIEFAVDHPELQRVMFGTRASLKEGGFAKTGSYMLLSKALDDLVAEGMLPADRRPGAELRAWTVVEGFASLVLQGVGGVQKKASRTAALESILDFAYIGLCGRLG